MTIAFYAICIYAAFQSLKRSTDAAPRCECWSFIANILPGSDSTIEEDFNSTCNWASNVNIEVIIPQEDSTLDPPSTTTIKRTFQNNNNCPSVGGFFNTLWRTRFGYKCLQIGACRAAIFLFIRGILIGLLLIAPIMPEVAGGILFGLVIFDYDLETNVPSFNMINMILLSGFLCIALVYQAMNKRTIFDVFALHRRREVPAQERRDGRGRYRKTKVIKV